MAAYCLSLATGNPASHCPTSEIPPPLVDFVSIPGTFFLATPLHLVTTATLGYLKSKNEWADWDLRRFRPNFLIETSILFASKEDLTDLI